MIRHVVDQTPEGPKAKVLEEVLCRGPEVQVLTADYTLGQETASGKSKVPIGHRRLGRHRPLPIVIVVREDVGEAALSGVNDEDSFQPEVDMILSMAGVS